MKPHKYVAPRPPFQGKVGEMPPRDADAPEVNADWEAEKKRQAEKKAAEFAKEQARAAELRGE